MKIVDGGDLQRQGWERIQLVEMEYFDNLHDDWKIYFHHTKDDCGKTNQVCYGEFYVVSVE